MSKEGHGNCGKRLATFVQSMETKDIDQKKGMQ